jgi:hypothetical protein
MAGIIADVTRAASNTSTGTQDITIADFGTPKAALLMATYTETDGTAIVDSGFSIGACDGTNQWTVHCNSEDAQGTTDTNRETSTSKVVIINTPGTNVAYAEAAFSAWITDGIRINWTTAPATAILVTVVLFGGDDLSVHVNNKQLSDTVDTTTDITDPGFESDLVIAATAGISSATASGNIIQPLSIGIVHNDRASTITQRCMAFADRNGQATSRVLNAMRSDSGLVAYSSIVAAPSETQLDWYADFNTFDSSGFSITEKNAGANSSYVFYLALRLGSSPTVDGKIITYTPPTSTGNDGETGVGFTPQLVLGLQTRNESLNSASGTGAAGDMTTGMFAFSSNNEYDNTFSSEDNVATSNTQSLSDDQAINFPDDTGSAFVGGSFVSMDANGFTINYSAVHSSALQWAVLAIEEEAAAGGGDSIPYLSGLRKRRFQPQIVR